MQNKENAKAGIGERFIAGAKSIGKNYQLYLLLLPGLLWYLAFAYRPMTGLRIAFYDYNIFKGIAGSSLLDSRISLIS